MLFGDQFAKEREDQLRALDRATNRSNFQRPQNFQCRRPPLFNGGGGMNPGRQGYQFGAGRGCFRPHQFKAATRGKENFAPRGEERRRRTEQTDNEKLQKFCFCVRLIISCSATVTHLQQLGVSNISIRCHSIMIPPKVVPPDTVPYRVVCPRGRTSLG